MSAWITVAASLGGVGLGALISGITAWNLDKARYEREQAARWNDERRRLYVEYLREAEAFEKASRALAKQSDSAHLRIEWGRHANALEALTDEIELIATGPVRRALGILTSKRYTLSLTELDEGTSSNELSKWADELIEALVDFKLAVRKELGVVD
jgi:hypothetical protein